MASVNEKILEFLKKNDYVVVVKKIKGGFDIKWPELKDAFNKIPSSIERFIIKGGKNSKITIINKERNDVELPSYIIRSFITTRLFVECNNIGYDINYLIFQDKNGKEIGVGGEYIDDFLKGIRGVNIEKEDLLLNLLLERATGTDLQACRKIAEEKEILEGFDLITNFKKEEV